MARFRQLQKPFPFGLRPTRIEATTKISKRKENGALALPWLTPMRETATSAFKIKTPAYEMCPIRPKPHAHPGFAAERAFTQCLSRWFIDADITLCAVQFFVELLRFLWIDLRDPTNLPGQP